jgi:hypothetical protein
MGKNDGRLGIAKEDIKKDEEIVINISYDDILFKRGRLKSDKIDFDETIGLDDLMKLGSDNKSRENQ